MDPIANYQLQCKQASAMVHDYYNEQPPGKLAPAQIPLVPCDVDNTPLVPTVDVPFKYVELAMPDGRNLLAIVTPFECSRGPGERYICDLA